MNWKCVTKPYLLLGSQRERGVKICQRESIFTSELWLLSHNFPINNDWGNHYLLVNYDMESLFREAKILRDTGVISFFATRKCQKIRKIDENSWYSKSQCWYFFFYFVFYVVTNFLFINLVHTLIKIDECSIYVNIKCVYNTYFWWYNIYYVNLNL